MLWHGKNFRGIINKAKEMIFDNTGTNLSSTNAEDAIKEVNSNLSANKVGTEIVISTDSSNPTIFASDGYVFVTVHSGSKIVVELMDGNGTQIQSLVMERNTSSWDSQFIWVKKGMRAYRNTPYETGSDKIAIFLPITC